MARTDRPIGDHRGEIVMAAGGATTLAALALVFALAHHDVNVMGWYANYILPAGALLVGVVAASGYGVAGWFTGLKVTRRMMWSIVGQLALSYFIAQYEEYRLMVPAGAHVGFWQWFDLTTRAFSFAQHDGTPGSPFGAAGYAFRLLEIAGFVAGGVVVPVVLRSKPYCDPCRSYKRSRIIGWIAGGIVPLSGPYSSGIEGLEAITRSAEAGDPAAFRTVLEERASLARKREVLRHEERICLFLARCPRCSAGELAPVLQQVHGRQVRTSKLPLFPLPAERVRELFDTTT